MKYFHFALSGMVVLLYLFSSCSNGETESGKQEVIEKITQDDGTEAYEETPVTKNDEEAPADGIEPDTSSPDDEDGDPPDETPGVLSLKINELRFGSSGEDSVGFIEFKILSVGNLGGLRVFIASNVNPLVYEFPSVEVNIGEYVVLHLRKSEDLNESGGTDSSPTARDFWVHEKNQLLRKNDAIYIMDQDELVVLDAVIILENANITVTEWTKLSDFFPPIIKFLFKEGAWKSRSANGTIPSPADAVNVSTAVNDQTRSVSRDETVKDTDTAADWYITSATPGRENTR